MTPRFVEPTSVTSAAEPDAAIVRISPGITGTGTASTTRSEVSDSSATSAVVGSAIVKVIDEAAREGRDVGKAVEEFVRWLKTGA
jgi:tryptophan synthase alpha subunit